MDTPSGPASPRARWHETLAKFDLTVVYVPGKDNTVADCLSRWAYPASKGMTDVSAHGDDAETAEAKRIIEMERLMEKEGVKCFVVMAADSPFGTRMGRAVRVLAPEGAESDKHLFPESCLQDDWTDDYAKSEAFQAHFLSVYFFSIDPQHFVDGSNSSPGYSVIGENPRLFKFWSLSRSFQIITSIPESKSTLATFQLTPSRLFVHPEKTMNFTLFGSSKAADDGLSTLFNYSLSHLFQKHQASNSPLQTRFPSRQYEAIEGKIFDTRQRIFVPEVYRRLQDYSEFYLDVEGTDIQSAFVVSNSTEILDRGRVSSVAHNNYNELEKLLFKHKCFYLKPYELDYSQTEAKKSPPTATPWAKQLRTVLDKAKDENKNLKGWFVIPAWDAQVVAATFRMLGSTSALFPLLPYISSVICMHRAQLRDAYKVKKDGKDSYEFRTSGHQTMPYVALLLNTSSFDGCRYEDISFKFEPFRFASKHAHPTVRDL